MSSETASPGVRELLDAYTVTLEWPVAWHDMDALRHVNNAKFFEYFEHARVAYEESLDSFSHGWQAGVGPILADIYLKFHKPLFYPDTVALGISITELKSTQYRMKFIAVSREREITAATGRCLIVFYDYEAGMRTEIPPRVAEAVRKLEGI